MLYIGENSCKLTDRFGEHLRSVGDTIIIPAIMEEVFPWPSTLIWPTQVTAFDSLLINFVSYEDIVYVFWWWRHGYISFQRILA